MVPCAGRLWAEAQVPEGLAPDADPSYINELTAKAKELKLHESRMWTVLLHYRSKRFGGVESDADGPRFFLTPNMKGKTDPQAEMDGTLRAFFQPVGENPNVHPQCLFPARYEWLKNTLQFDPKRLPDRACPILHVWFDHINAESVSIMFASFFMSAPASMFGHTLIKLNTKRQGAVREHELLNFALNFAADPGGLDPVRYVLYGLFGGFPGYFALLPYHIKVREYNDIENRDMWEYHLSLTPDEIRRMFYHAWELQSTHFDYFYMDENCSFHLLSLLEVARPTLQLTDGFWFWVIPGETIKRVLAQPGLVTQVKYRPSLFSEIVQRVGALTPEEKEMLYTVIAGGKADLAPGTSPDKDARTAEILDTALMILRFRSEPEKMDAVDRTHYRELLRARTELPPAPVRDPGEP
ncbi:MAG: DUF4105 domain-containing protein, partial [Spirochaetia bacterium]|nr:DUF4105 domain-containing protein [Spirochaetia bacterium]